MSSFMSNFQKRGDVMSSLRPNYETRKSVPHCGSCKPPGIGQRIVGRLIELILLEPSGGTAAILHGGSAICLQLSDQIIIFHQPKFS